MVDEVDNAASEADEPAGPLCGERLAIARRELNISVLDIAKELHLDEPKVRALERNEFDVLGAPVFAKGHLKKYAELVNVQPEDVLVDYYRMHRTADMPPVVAPRPRARQELSPGPWIAIIVVVVVAVTAYFWFTRPQAPEPEARPVATPEEIAQPPLADEADEQPDLAEPDLAEPPVSEEAAAEPPPRVEQPVIEETESPEIAEGQMRLLLTYSGDCWTEVTDATGRRLFFALGTDGRTVELSGAEPFNVLIGSPGSVALEVNGDDYALPATARPNRPLRLTISGS